MNHPYAHEEMLAEVVPPKLLPRILTRFDLVTIYFAIIFGSYGAAQLAAQGWAGISMLVLAAVTFLLPCALASYELGTLFPSEGGIYVWAYKTLGPVHGFIAGWLAWMPIFPLLPLNAAVIIAHLQYALGQTWSLPTQVICQVLFVWILLSISVLRLRTSQSIVRVMFFVALGTAASTLLAGLFTSSAGTPLDQEIVSLDLRKYGSLYSAAVLWLLGAEVPFNMGAEFSDHKRTGRTMFTWGTVVLLIAYVMGIAGILMTTPMAAIDQTTGLARAVGSVFPVGGAIVAVAICLAVFAQATSTMNAYSRLLFIGGIEKKLPETMAHLSQQRKTPWPAMVVQAIGATMIILIFATQTQLTVTYNLYLATLVAVWCASLYYVYIGVIRARRLYTERYLAKSEAIWCIPGGRIGIWLCCLLGVFFNTLAIYYVFAKPWTSGISVHGWRWWLGVTSVVIILIGLLAYRYGHRKQHVLG